MAYMARRGHDDGTRTSAAEGMHEACADRDGSQVSRIFAAIVGYVQVISAVRKRIDDTAEFGLGEGNAVAGPSRVQPARINIINRVIISIHIPVVAAARRVLANEPAGARVIIPMAHQNQAGVQVRLAPVRSPVPERRRAACRRERCAEARKVDVPKLVLRGAIQRLQVAEAVEAVVVADPAPVLRQPRHVQGVAVRQHGSAGGCSVAHIAVAARAVRFAHTQAETVVSVGIRGVGCDHLGQAVFVVISKRIQVAVNRHTGFLTSNLTSATTL